MHTQLYISQRYAFFWPPFFFSRIILVSSRKLRHADTVLGGFEKFLFIHNEGQWKNYKNFSKRKINNSFLIRNFFPFIHQFFEKTYYRKSRFFQVLKFLGKK